MSEKADSAVVEIGALCEDIPSGVAGIQKGDEAGSVASGEGHSTSVFHHIDIDKNLKSSFVTGHYILNDVKPMQWVIQGIIPEGGIALLSAPPSNFKTWMAFDMAHCVSLGIPFLGRDSQQKLVFYIDNENPPVVQQQYLKQLGVIEESPLAIWPQWHNLVPPVFPNNVYLQLAQTKPLLVFDSFIRFYPSSANENSANDMARVIGFLRLLTSKVATILILYHTGKGKGSEYRGSSDILGGVDIAFTVKNRKKIDNSSTSYVLKCIKRRYSQKDNTRVKDYGTGEGPETSKNR